MSGFNSFIASIGGRKFIVALIGLIAIVFGAKLGIEITPEAQAQLGTVVGGYILGQGIADGLSGGKTSTVATANAEAAKPAASTDAG